MIDISKFDDLEDLSISKEMLGAYLEGNLHGSEYREVYNFIQDDNTMADLVDSVKTDFEDMNDFGISEISCFEPVPATNDPFLELALPDISSFGMESLIDSSSSLTDDLIIGSDCHNFVEDDSHFPHSNEHDHSLNYHDPELDCGTSNVFE